MDTIIPHYMDGESVIEESPRHKTIYNPALGEPIAKVHFATPKLIEKTIATAKGAFPAWANTSPIKRAHCLFTFRELLIENETHLAEMVTREHGKTLDDAKASIKRGIEAVEHYTGLLSKLQGTFSINASHDVDVWSFREPLGVSVGISPFNFPVMVPIWMMIPAIASGNAFILKPSEQDPSSPHFLMELLTKAGVPKGVVNLLQGDSETVNALITHEDVQTVTAVASSAVAKHIYETAIMHGKRAHTFGGAKNHAVVLPDADMKQAAEAICSAAYGSAGERCMALSAVVTVGNDVKEALLSHLIPLTQHIRVDVGDAIDCDMGPLISEAHRERVLSAIDEGVREGASLTIDGRHFSHPLYPQGFFLGPSLFTDVTPTMSIYQEEIFGPVLVVLSVDTFEEAISLVNSHRYGNGTAIFTQNPSLARQYAREVSVGMIGINIPIPVPIVSHPFGGLKESIFGDTLMHADESFHFYTRGKTVTSRWSVASHTSFSLPQHTGDK